MIHVREIKERIDGMVVEPQSERGQEIIHEDDRTHVLEVWEDGEVTSTKAGDLYNARRLHQSARPFIPTQTPNMTLFDVPDDQEHKRMVVADREVLDILDEYRDVPVNRELIEFLEENGFYDDE